MAIIIQRGQGSPGRTAPGFTQYTGMMFYGTAPSDGGWITSTNPVTIKQMQILSVQDALDNGILPNTDNVANTHTTVCTIGDIGDVCLVQATIPIVGGTTKVIDLCEVTLATATLTLQINEIRDAINSLTYSTGFSSTTSSGTTITLIAPTYLGVYFNTGTNYTFTVTPIGSPVHTFVFGAETLVISGTASLYSSVYYHISEYYRKNPTGNLRVGFISATSSRKEIVSLQIASGNQLRQIGIFDTNTSSGLAANLQATVEGIQSAIATITTPFQVIYQPNIKSVSDLSTLPNGNDNTTGTNVQVIISQDGLAQGNLLYRESGYSIGNLGCNLGVLSASRVSSSIAQPIQQNNCSDGVENNTPALANGQLLSSLSVPEYQQLFGTVEDNVSGYCYIGFITYPGEVSGTFFSGNAMFTDQASRYAFMNDNRVWDMVARICVSTYTPYLNSEVQFNSDGTISNITIVYLQNIGVQAITAAMITGINPPYISGTPVVTIDPTQKLQQTNKLLISVSTTENGIARNIIITNGFSN